jgi:hypothetical protein
MKERRCESIDAPAPKENLPCRALLDSEPQDAKLLLRHQGQRARVCNRLVVRPSSARSIESSREYGAYCTKRPLKRTYSCSEIDPASLSRSSFWISSAALKPTIWR